MKKLLLVLLVGMLLAGCGGESSSNRKDRDSDSSSDHTSEEKQLIGEWKGTDSTGSTASMIFNDDGSAIFIEGRKVMDGAAIGGSVTWELDSNHDPMHLDLVVSKSTGETRTAQAIIRFLGENKIQIRHFRDRSSRPSSFSKSPNDDQVILTRQYPKRADRHQYEKPRGSEDKVSDSSNDLAGDSNGTFAGTKESDTVARAEEERKRQEEERRLAEVRAEEERKRQEEERRLAEIRAEEERRLAAIRAEEERKRQEEVRRLAAIKPVQPKASVELLRIVNNWKRIPLSAFPRQVTVSRPVKFVVRDSAGNSVANTSSPKGSVLFAFEQVGNMIVVGPTQTSPMRQMIGIDDTDLKQVLIYAYEMNKYEVDDDEPSPSPSSLPSPKPQRQLNDKAFYDDLTQPKDYGHGKWCVCVNCRKKRASER